MLTIAVSFLFNPIKQTQMLRKIWDFYYTGFKEMTVGKTLWILIAIKLFIMFFILKLFFFKGALSEYDTDLEKGQKVIENLTH